MLNAVKEKNKIMNRRYSQTPTNSKQLQKTLSSNFLDKSLINISNSSKNLSRYANNTKDQMSSIQKSLTSRDKKFSIFKKELNNSPPINQKPTKLPLTSKSIEHKASLSFLLNKLSPIKKSSLTQQLSHHFVHETIHLMNSKGLDKFKNYQQVRKKIINDFQDKTTNDSIQSSRQNYNQTVLFLELNHLKDIKKSQAFEKEFYQMKKTNLFFGKKINADEMDKMTKEAQPEDSNISYIESRRNYFKKKQEQIEQTIYQLSKEMVSMDCNEYESLKDKKKKMFNKININNLQRKIKIYSIAKNNYDDENDDLILKNIPKLKRLIKESEEEVILQLKNYTPIFMKTIFRSKTMNRFKAASGNNFGLP